MQNNNKKCFDLKFVTENLVSIYTENDLLAVSGMLMKRLIAFLNHLIYGPPAQKNGRTHSCGSIPKASGKHAMFFFICCQI